MFTGEVSTAVHSNLSSWRKNSEATDKDLKDKIDNDHKRWVQQTRHFVFLFLVGWRVGVEEFWNSCWKRKERWLFNHILYQNHSRCSRNHQDSRNHAVPGQSALICDVCLAFKLTALLWFYCQLLWSSLQDKQRLLSSHTTSRPVSVYMVREMVVVVLMGWGL